MGDTATSLGNSVKAVEKELPATVKWPPTASELSRDLEWLKGTRAELEQLLPETKDLDP